MMEDGVRRSLRRTSRKFGRRIIATGRIKCPQRDLSRSYPKEIGKEMERKKSEEEVSFQKRKTRGTKGKIDTKGIRVI